MTDATCAIHADKPIKYRCERCQKPLCDACGAVAFDGKVYCSACAAAVDATDASPSVQSPDAKLKEKGVGRGIAITLLMPFVVAPVAALLAWLASTMPQPMQAAVRSSIALLLWPGGWLIVLLIAVNKKRTGIVKGMLIGLLIQVALGILLLAACFGVLFVGGVMKR